VALGGLSRSSFDVARVLDAWQARVVLIETVGVGQDELEVTRGAHTTLVVMAPGLGDDVQASKAGLLECADVFAVNKADRDGADATVRDLELMVALGADILSQARLSFSHSASVHSPALDRTQLSEDRWEPPVLKCVATTGQGMSELIAALERHRSWLDSTALGKARRAERLREQLLGFLRDTLAEEAVAALGAAIDDAAQSVAANAVDPYTACDDLIARFRARG